MSTGKSRVRAPEISFVNVPLEADAYYVNVSPNMDDNTLRRLRLEWQKMNRHLERPKVLMVLPQDMTLKQMPSEVLEMWIEKCTDVLKGRAQS